ncbi:MAG: AI-2E family transporter [Deltaproteobacteria bacterium]|nr:AI-2E family transporter [Deltaproteobacteria bacterium]
MIEVNKTKTDIFEISSWIITGLALWLVFYLHLFSALLAGLLVFQLVNLAAPLLHITQISRNRAKLLVVGILSIIIVFSLILLIWGIVLFFKSDASSLSVLLSKMAEILDNLRGKLPHGLVGYVPDDIDGLRTETTGWLRAHAADLQAAGTGMGRLGAHILIGMIIGAIISLSSSTNITEYRPLARALAERAGRFSDAFRSIVFAQVRIAALNTLFTWLYLGVALPLFGIHLPLVKTMVAVTFIIGLLPVVGNLVSNAIIVVVSLSQSLGTSIASLGFLVVIHKLEYFLNARIVGSQIKAHTWELLVAMLIMESAFGFSGVIAAPIYYAYLKRELLDRELI